MLKIYQLLCIALIMLLLTACGPDLNSNSYDYYDGAAGYGRVARGVIKEIQYHVKVRKNDNFGTVVGGVTGAIIGSHIGGSDSRINAVGTIGSVVVGSIAGNAVESAISNTEATLYVVKLNDSGHLLSVIEKSTLPLREGDHVYLIDVGGRPHLVLDKNYQQKRQKLVNGR